MDLSLLFDVSYGMYIVATQEENRPGGCIINTCMQITSENPIMAISLNKSNYTYEMIRNTNRFSIAILSEDTRPELFGIFGFRSGKNFDKFANCNYEIVEGLPVIKENCCGTMLFDVTGERDMDTHAVIFGRLTNTIKTGDFIPMTYSYYHSVIKGKAPKSAPTYQK